MEIKRYPGHRISRVTWAEVLAGEPADRRSAVERLIKGFELVEVDQRIAATAAEIRYGTRIKLLDAFILATARVNGAILITRDTKAFPAGMPGIRIPYTI